MEFAEPFENSHLEIINFHLKSRCLCFAVCFVCRVLVFRQSLGVSFN